MKSFKLIALVALTLVSVTHVARAELGRATSTDEVSSGSFVCETTGKIVKRHISSADVHESKQREADGAVGTVRSGQ